MSNNPTTHSPEPWTVIQGGDFIADREGETICKFFNRDEQDYPHLTGNTERIVACVNAMEGIPDPAAYMEVIKRLKLDNHDRQEIRIKNLKAINAGLQEQLASLHSLLTDHATQQLQHDWDRLELLELVKLAISNPVALVNAKNAHAIAQAQFPVQSTEDIALHDRFTAAIEKHSKRQPVPTDAATVGRMRYAIERMLDALHVIIESVGRRGITCEIAKRAILRGKGALKQ